MKDFDLINGLLSNNKKAIDYIYEHFFNRIKYYIQNKGGSLDDAKDVFQEALIIIYKKAKEETFELKSIYEKALTAQPSIKAGELNMKSAELGISIAKANKMPRLTAFAQLNSNFSSRAPDTDIIDRGYKVDPVFGPSPINQVLIDGVSSTFQSTGQVVVNQPEFFTQKYFNQFVVIKILGQIEND